MKTINSDPCSHFFCRFHEDLMCSWFPSKSNFLMILIHACINQVTIIITNPLRNFGKHERNTLNINQEISFLKGTNNLLFDVHKDCRTRVATQPDRCLRVNVVHFEGV